MRQKSNEKLFIIYNSSTTNLDLMESLDNDRFFLRDNCYVIN